MVTSRLAFWARRFANWLGIRTGLLRGRWVRFAVEVPGVAAPWSPLAGWWAGLFSAAWWPWPWPWSPAAAASGTPAAGAAWAPRATWRAAIYRPAGLADDEAAPLVVVLHGCGQRALGFAHAAGFTREAERRRLRLLAPEQRRGANPHRCWNWFLPQAQHGRGELAVVLAAIDAAAARVRTSEVLAVGLSAGGALAALLAFHHAPRFAAVAVAGAPPLLGRLNLRDPRRVLREGLGSEPTLAVFGHTGCAPLLVLHGANDEVVAPRCAAQLAEQARAAMGLARAAAAAPAAAAAGDLERVDAAGRPLLRLHVLPGLAHGWSGAARGGHPWVERAGPPLLELVFAFFHARGALR